MLSGIKQSGFVATSSAFCDSGDRFFIHAATQSITVDHNFTVKEVRISYQFRRFFAHIF